MNSSEFQWQGYSESRPSDRALKKFLDIDVSREARKVDNLISDIEKLKYSEQLVNVGRGAYCQIMRGGCAYYCTITCEAVYLEKVHTTGTFKEPVYISLEVFLEAVMEWQKFCLQHTCSQ